MKKLTYNETTVTALGGCVFCSKKSAEACFSGLGIKGDTELCRVRTENGKNYVLWINRDVNNLNFLPLFFRDIGLCFDSLRNVAIAPLADSTLICYEAYRGYVVCYIFLKGQDDVVRRVRIFADETVIKNYCKVQGIIPNSVELCKAFSIKENRYISTYWSVCYENPNSLDKNGEARKYEILIPVDLTDSDVLDEIGIPNIYLIYLKEGETFQVQRQLYRVLKDENGLFLTKDLFTRFDENSRDLQSSEKKQKAEICLPDCCAQ